MGGKRAAVAGTEAQNGSHVHEYGNADRLRVSGKSPVSGDQPVSRQTYHTSGDLQSFWCYLALAAICLTLDVLVTINLLRTIHGRGKRRRKNS